MLTRSANSKCCAVCSRLNQGAAAAARLTSYTAKGTYEGFDSDFEQVPVDIYARAPNMRATVIHMRGGDSSTIVDGREAVSFLVAVKDRLEAPERLLVEV